MTTSEKPTLAGSIAQTELIRMARQPESEPPAVLAAALSRLEATQREAEDALWHRDDLIREARALGVSWVALNRWTGISLSRLDQIVNDR